MGSSVPLMYGASGLPFTDGQLRFSITITKTVCILPGSVTPAVWAKLASVLVKLKSRTPAKSSATARRRRSPPETPNSPTAPSLFDYFRAQVTMILWCYGTYCRCYQNRYERVGGISASPVVGQFGFVAVVEACPGRGPQTMR